MTQILEAALEYAARGWPVLPLRPNDKRPLTRNGILDASSDPEKIRGWFERWPTANLGIATGAPGPQVLDIDKPDEAPAELVNINAPTVATGRGRHMYFEGTDDGTIGLGYGELRGRGSYVVAPPSTHPSGARYDWTSGGDVVFSVPEFVTEGRQRPGTGVMPEVKQVPPGEMYEHLLDLSIRCARAGMSIDAAEVALKAEFERVRIPGVEYGGDESDTLRLAAAPSRIRGDVAAADLDDFGPVVVDPVPLKGDDTQATTPSSSQPDPGNVATTLLDGRDYDLAELMQKEDEPLVWRCEGFVADGTLTMLAGRAGSGKTWLGMGLAFGVARGQEATGIPCAKGKAGIVDFEMGERLYRGRVRAANLDPQAGEIRYLDAQGLDLANRDHRRAIFQWAQRNELDFVLIDSLKRGTPSLKENDNDEMAAIVGALGRGARALGAAVLLLHHQGRDPDKWFRGATAIQDQTDALFGLVPVTGDEDTLRLSSKGTWGKMRYEEAPDDVYLRLSVEDGGMVPTERPVTKDEQALTLEQQLRALVQEHGSVPSKKWAAEWLATYRNNPVLDLLVRNGEGRYVMADEDHVPLPTI